jgi:hypothetical protein
MKASISRTILYTVLKLENRAGAFLCTTSALWACPTWKGNEGIIYVGNSTRGIVIRHNNSASNIPWRNQSTNTPGI